MLHYFAALFHRLTTGITSSITGKLLLAFLVGLLAIPCLPANADEAEVYYTLQVGTVGGGSVQLEPNQTTFPEGAVVRVTAVPDEGWYFRNWRGFRVWPDGISWNFDPTVDIVMDHDKNLTGYFCLVTPDPVEIPDVNFRSAIVDYLEKPPEAVICRSEMAVITHLNAYERGITDLTGIEYCTNLEILPIYGNNLTGIAPLEYCTKLTAVHLGFNHITDITPLVNNPGLNGATIWLEHNDLDLSSDAVMGAIANLQARGCTVTYEPQRTGVQEDPSPQPEPCTLTIAVDGHGAVTCSPEGSQFLPGTQLTLTAAPENDNYRFSGWSGDISGSDNPVVFTISSSISVTASFAVIDAGGDEPPAAGDPPANGGTSGGAPAPVPVSFVGGIGGGNPNIAIRLSGFTADTVQTDSSGVLLKSCRLQTPDEDVFLDISKGTRLTDKLGQPIPSLSLSRLEDVPAPPPEYAAVAAYELGPEGSVFDPGMDLGFYFDPGSLPAQADASRMDIVSWNGSAWQFMDGYLDREAGTVTAQITNCGAYALAARLFTPAEFQLLDLTVSPTLVEPGTPVTITAAIANTGELEGSYHFVLFADGAIENNSRIIIGPAKTVSQTVILEKDEPGTHEVNLGKLTTSFIVREPAPAVQEKETAPEPAIIPPIEPEPEPEPVAAITTEPAKEPAVATVEETTNNHNYIYWAAIGGIIALALITMTALYFRKRS